MFGPAIKKAHDAVEDVAYETVLGLAAMILGCGAVLLAAGGVAIWFADFMPIYAAIFIAAGFVAIVAGVVFLFSRMDPPQSEEAKKKEIDAPASSVADSLTSLAKSVDVMASGLFARQFRKAPVATIAATVAIGAVLGLIAGSQDD